MLYAAKIDSRDVSITIQQELRLIKAANYNIIAPSSITIIAIYQNL